MVERIHIHNNTLNLDSINRNKLIEAKYNVKILYETSTKAPSQNGQNQRLEDEYLSRQTNDLCMYVIEALKSRRIPPGFITLHRDSKSKKIHGMEAFNITYKSKVQVNNFIQIFDMHVFGNGQGMFVDFLPWRREEGIVNAETYCEALNKLRTQELIASYGWEELDHPPYYPDLVPRNYHLFLHGKKHLSSQRYDTDDVAKTAVLQSLANKAADIYEDELQKLVLVYDKYLNIARNYIEY